MWIVKLALRRPYTIAVLSFVIFLMGLFSSTQMRADIFPTIDIPVVIVVWTYAGMPAEEMERRIVLPSERAYSTTVDGVSGIESQSMAGIGLVKIYFASGSDIGGAIGQITSVSLAASRNMPPGLQPPAVLRYNASNVPVAQLTVTNPKQSEQEIFDYGMNFIRVRLFTVPGLATPYPYGGRARQVMIDIDPTAAASRGLSSADVVQTLLQSNLIIPAGSARMGETEYDVALNNNPTSIDDFNKLPVKVVNGAPILLGDIAKVHDGFAVQQNIVRVNGQRATYLAILKKASASTIAVVDGAKDLIPTIKAVAPEGMEVKLDFDQSVFVRAAIAGVLREAFMAATLVAIMIHFFLGSWRSVVIVLTSIPLAILTALAGLYLTGQTLNIMTLSGLALAIGMLVDDATVEVENIHRNRHLGKPLTVAILDGAEQVAVPALAATLTICIVFLPVALFVGPAKYLFTPLALSVVFSMLASYVLSRTLVPSLARMLMEKEQIAQLENHLGDRILRRLTTVYEAVLGVVLNSKKLVIAFAVGMVIIAAPLIKLVGLDFFPEVDAGQMRLHVRAPIGLRIEDTEHLVGQVDAKIREVIAPSDLSAINDMIGVPNPVNLAFAQTDNIGGQDADVLISLKPHHKPTAEYRQRLRSELTTAFPSVHFYFQPADIISQVLNFGVSAPVDVQIEGKDLDQSMALARELREDVRGIPGAVDVRIPQVLDHPAFEIDVDRERAAQVGLAQKDVAITVLTSLSGSALTAPSFWLNPQNGVQYTVAAQTPIAKEASLDDLLGTPVTGEGTHTGRAAGDPTLDEAAPYLGMFAKVRPSQSKALISHTNVQRVVDVQLGVEGRDLGAVTADVEHAIAALLAKHSPLPAGTKIRVHGQSESMMNSFRSLGFGLIVASVLVYMLLALLYQSWIDPLIIMTTIPGALVGVLWMLAVTHTTLNVESLMGAIMAVGVAVANSILLVNFANDVRADNDIGPARAALEAGRTRFRPVLMTALAMILGMLPMALGLGEGAEQNAPLGRAVIGGLLAATVVTLLIVPLVYTLIRRRPPTKHLLDRRFENEVGKHA